MNKISVIIRREYLTRVRKKSFIIMTILAPLLMAAIIIIPTTLMMSQSGEHKKIAVVEDKTDLFKGVLKNTDETEFVYLGNTDLQSLKKMSPMPFSLYRENSRQSVCYSTFPIH